jgi:hypothetical protein
MIRLLAVSPIVWLALIMSALTIGWCLNLLTKLSHPHLRICTYMVLLVCVFQDVHLLREQDVLRFPVNYTVVSVVELCVTILYFCLILIFQIHNKESRKDHVRLRLAEASENAKVIGEPIVRQPVLQKAQVT